MKIRTLASGSSGNCAIVSHLNTHILIDAGISARRISAALNSLSIDPAILSAILITHEHSDHISGLPVFLKRCHAPVYSSHATARALIASSKILDNRITPITPSVPLLIRDIQVSAFDTPHDTPQSFGFTLESNSAKLAYSTDLGHVSPDVFRAVSGADIVLLEANHDVDMLKCGTYPFHIKQRILGNHGHLSNAASADFIARLIPSGTSSVILAHLSRDNNSPDTALNTIRSRLLQDGIRECDFRLSVAPPDHLSDFFEV